MVELFRFRLYKTSIYEFFIHSYMTISELRYPTIRHLCLKSQVHGDSQNRPTSQNCTFLRCNIGGKATDSRDFQNNKLRDNHNYIESEVAHAHRGSADCKEYAEN